MKKLSGAILAASLFLGMACVATAQENNMSGEHKPPKILTVTREFVKPGKSGAAHDKTESMFVSAMAAAKWPTHYLAMDSVTGKPRTLFFTGYESFEAWEKDVLAEAKNATLSAALDRANEADGSLLDSTETSAFFYRDDLSYNSAVDIPHMRMFEIEAFIVKPGHEKEFEDAVKMVSSAYSKAIPDAHWATYQEVYGAAGNEYIILTPMKSASEIDKGFANYPKWIAAMGDDGMKKLNEMSASSLAEQFTNIFVFSATKSYVDEGWIKADPDFWKHKAMAKKTEEKREEKKKE